MSLSHDRIILLMASVWSLLWEGEAAPTAEADASLAHTALDKIEEQKYGK